jgi:hypothetical protein
MVASHVNTQLPPIARFGQAGMPDVILEIEARVVGPIRIIEFEWHVHKTPFENGRGVQSAPHMRDDVFETHMAAWRGRRIVDAKARDMRQVVFGFHVQKSGVLRFELL